MKFLFVIPARYASTRFPGKPLAVINGMSMIQRVYEQVGIAVNKLGNADVLVATDDERILSHVLGFGGKVVMTADSHPSGTDRVAEAANLVADKPEVVINVQGDEPFIRPEQILQLAACFNNSETQIATLVKTIHTNDELTNTNVVKAVVDLSGRALYFSRSAIPFHRDTHEKVPQHKYLKHIGVYGFRFDVLQRLTQLDQSPLERMESLEQLRWLENGYSIQTAITEYESVAIDHPDDLKKLN